MRKGKSNWTQLVIAIGLCEIVGAVGSLFTISSIPGWYAELLKPDATPPNWLFGPVWTILFAFMGAAAWIIWSKGWHKKEVRVALSIFALQLGLNLLWSVIFFGFQHPGAAFGELVLLWLAIGWTIAVFEKISKPAALLLLPYMLWVSFALYLNWSIWTLNG